MNNLEFAEKASSEALDDARKAYDALHERIYKFATFLAGGAGGVGVYALGKIGAANAASQFFPLAALSLYWFILVGAVLVKGASSRQLTAGTTSKAIRERLNRYSSSGSNDENALWLTRWDQLASVDKQIEDYADGTSRRARSLDIAYTCLACSPAIPAIAYLFTL
jgi:hypothetical protein